MKMTGCITEAEELDSYHWEVTDAIVTTGKIQLDWLEDGDSFHAVLVSTDKGCTYAGNFGCPRPEKHCYMEATRFDSRAGEVLLWTTWHRTDTGQEGHCLIHLATLWN